MYLLYVSIIRKYNRHKILLILYICVCSMYSRFVEICVFDWVTLLTLISIFIWCITTLNFSHNFSRQSVLFQYTIVLQNFIAASFYDDGSSLDVVAILDNKTHPSFIISPYRGNPIPNLISVKINKQELCNNGVYKVWNLCCLLPC